MKKLTMFLLSVVIMLSLCSCSDNKTISLQLPSGEVTGTYVGDLEKGLPHGTGTFECADNDEIIWRYTGEWSDGLMSGTGKIEWTNGRTYEGEYQSGTMNGVVSVYEKNELLFKGLYNEGTLVGYAREVVPAPDSEPMQYIKVGDKGFRIPKAWSCEVVDDKYAYVQIPDADNVQIIFSITEYMDGADDETRTTIKNGYLEHYAKGYSEYLVAAESEDGFFADTDEYDVQLTFFDGEKVLDVYSHSVFRDPILSEPATYTVTTIIDGGCYDYSKAAEYITYTMANWDAIQEDINKQIAEDEKNSALQYLNGEVDWDGLEASVQMITQQDILDRVCPKDALVLVEGIITNISDASFDLWLPHDGTYFREEGWKYDISLDGISEGATVEICIETHSDGSLKQSEGILAIRKLNVPVVDDMVALFKSSCKNFDFNAIMRNPEAAYGTIWKVTGTVFQVVETESYMQELLVETSNGDMVYVSYYKDDGADNLLEDDKITIYGTFYMTKTYMTLLGGEKTVPKLVVDYLDMR